MNLNELGYVAIQAALKAGDVLRRGYAGSFKVSKKTSQHDLVTEYDKAAEDAVISTVKERFPTHRFIAEESGGVLDSKAPVHWIIDPLDGTLNFVRHMPMFSVSIAAYSEGAVQVGVIYIPLLNELYVAQRGCGSYLNGTKIEVSKTANVADAVAVTGFPHRSNHDSLEHIERFTRLAHLGNPLRDLGSAAIHLAYVAAGRFDLFWIPRLSAWDMAAGKLLVEEAGGLVTHYDGSDHSIFPDSNLFASNNVLHPQFLPYLKR